MTANEVRLSLTNEQVINLMAQLGATEYKEDDKALIFRTICHNIDISTAKFKLYYYKDTKLFHCYSGCGDTFNIYELFKRYYELRGIHKSFYDIFSIISNGIQDDEQFDFYVYKKQDRHEKRSIIELPEYNHNVLQVFSKMYPIEWINEGISKETMDKYNILYSISQNKIIIPHYDINNRLVGIRGRALNPEEVELKGKYRPVFIEGKQYNHPLSLNLYGLNVNKDYINQVNSVILFESEKSVMMMDSYYKNKNNSVAVCGSNFNKNQLLILLQNCNINNIIIAFDKEYTQIGTEECSKYLEKLRRIGEKYNNYCTFYYIADRDNLLGYKDSPIDKGPEVFECLLSKKTLIRSL